MSIKIILRVDEPEVVMRKEFECTSDLIDYLVTMEAGPASSLAEVAIAARLLRGVEPEVPAEPLRGAHVPGNRGH